MMWRSHWRLRFGVAHTEAWTVNPVVGVNKTLLFLRLNSQWGLTWWWRGSGWEPVKGPQRHPPTKQQHTGAGSGGWGFWPPLCLVNMEGRLGGGGGWRVAWWNSGQQGLPENQSTSGMSKDTQAGLLEEGTHSRDERWMELCQFAKVAPVINIWTVAHQEPPCGWMAILPASLGGGGWGVGAYWRVPSTNCPGPTVKHG